MDRQVRRFPSHKVMRATRNGPGGRRTLQAFTVKAPTMRVERVGDVKNLQARVGLIAQGFVSRDPPGRGRLWAPGWAGWLRSRT